MNILLISPIVYPITPESRYAGMEKLVSQYAGELVKEHKVTVSGHFKSVYPEGVTLLPNEPSGNPFIQGELRQYQSYQYLMRGFDVIHDCSHSHFASRYMPTLKSVNPFWHAPSTGKYPKSPYNIVGLSKWACREFKKVYRQEARFLQHIVIDSEIYKPSGRGDRFLTLGRMSPEKGNLAAIMLCKQIGVELDVVGGRGIENEKAPLTDYEKAIHSLCDGKQVKFWGEVDDKTKIELMQKCKGLVYVLPPGYEEVTSHKVQEAMLCGAPIITAPIGALPEIITDKVDGYLCYSEKSYLDAIKNVDKLDPSKTRDKIAEEYSIKRVVNNFVELYQKVIDGERW